jgi:hypothetical protein
VLLPGRDRDGHFTAVLLASGLALWLSTGAVPLAESGPALREQLVPLALIGAAAGLLVGAFLHNLRPGRHRMAILATAGVFLLAMPFLTPFLVLQDVVPLFGYLRFPRFYTLAALGLSLGAAFPLTVLPEWLARRPHLPPLLPAAVGVTLVAAFVADVLPYRSYYQLHPPASRAAYDHAFRTLPADGPPSRVLSGLLEPGAAAAILDHDHQVTTGWPHPVAGRQLWRLTAETHQAPAEYREAALGLSATGHLAIEQSTGVGTSEETVQAVALVPNPRALPLVRAYEQAVVVEDPQLSPLLATGLAYRNVGVVTGPGDRTDLPAGMPTATVGRDAGCDRPSLAELGLTGGDVAVACALDPWLRALLAGTELVPVDQVPGAVFPAQGNGLRGVSVWLDRAAVKSELAVYEVGPDGVTLGPELARGQAVGIDEYGLTAFTFDAILDSAGRRFAFTLSCRTCPSDQMPRMVAGAVDDGSGNLIVGLRQRTDRLAAYAPVYDRVPPAASPAARLQAQSPAAGRWQVEIDSPNPTLLVVAEAWFPGWTATVDGESAPVLQADGAFLGLAVGPGRHVVRLSYRRPLAADAGRAITGATLLGLAVVAWRRRGRGPVAGGPTGEVDDDDEADEDDEGPRSDGEGPLDWDDPEHWAHKQDAAKEDAGKQQVGKERVGKEQVGTAAGPMTTTTFVSPPADSAAPGRRPARARPDRRPPPRDPPAGSAG